MERTAVCVLTAIFCFALLPIQKATSGDIPVKGDLFPDNDFRVHRTLGEVRTPYFFVVKQMDKGLSAVVYSKLGGLGNPDDFLRSLLK